MIWRVWDCGDEICGTLFFIFPARRECKKIDSFVGSKQNFVEYLKKKYGGTGKQLSSCMKFCRIVLVRRRFRGLVSVGKVQFKVLDGGNERMVQDIIDELGKVGKVVDVKESNIGLFHATVIEVETDVSEEECLAIINDVLNRKYSE